MLAPLRWVRRTAGLLLERSGMGVPSRERISLAYRDRDGSHRVVLTVLDWPSPERVIVADGVPGGDASDRPEAARQRGDWYSALAIDGRCRIWCRGHTGVSAHARPMPPYEARAWLATHLRSDGRADAAAGRVAPDHTAADRATADRAALEHPARQRRLAEVELRAHARAGNESRLSSARLRGEGPALGNAFDADPTP